MDKELTEALYYGKNADKWWEDTTIFNEYTPLLQENIEEALNSYAPFSHCYNNIADYIHECRQKDHMQVVGININGNGHWVAIKKEEGGFVLYDSSGMPANKIVDPQLKMLKNLKFFDAGMIRQSPSSNTCGEWAALYAIGDYRNDNPHSIVDQVTAKIIKYSPVTMAQFINVYVDDKLNDKLHMNDINCFNFFKYNLK